MGATRTRPVFQHPLACDAGVFFAMLAAALAEADDSCRGDTFGDYAILRLPAERSHFWSPALHLQVREASPVECRPALLHGCFSPSSSVWTLFLAAYGVLAIVATGGLMYGAAQWLLDRPAWALLAVPVAAILAAFTYGAAFIGQGLGAEDMYALRSFVDRVLERCAARDTDD